jgi:SAM-dependent methyltransferase
MDIKITNNFDLGRYMTFELSKEKPIHGWFWYKEGYASEFVEWAIKEFETKSGRKPQGILDPFCGVGTTLLCAKESSIASAGVDASSLAAFISKVKSQDYEAGELDASLAFLEKRLVPVEADWQFELFSPRAAFPRRNYNEILSIRYAIEQEEGRVQELLLLALLCVLPQASIILKDGGVLKIMKDKRALPAREIFKRKVKRMVRELREAKASGHTPQVFLGDARALDIPDQSVDAVITSPPYLNNIDYSKIYGLELSLLHMSKAEAESVRMRAIRSFIGKAMDVDTMPPEVGELGFKIPIIGTYFRDMEGAIAEMFRVLAPGGTAYVNVSNSVIHETHVMVDQVFAEMALRIGFSDVEIVVGAERVADVKPHKVRTRESVVMMRN